MCPGTLTAFNADQCVNSYRGTDAPNTGSKQIGLPYTDPRLVAGSWKVHVRNATAGGSNVGAGFSAPVNLTTNQPPVNPPVVVPEPILIVNGVINSGDVILNDRNGGYSVAVDNAVSGCYVRSSAAGFHNLQPGRTILPGSDPSHYPGFYFPKYVPTDLDTVLLDCPSLSRRINVKVKPAVPFFEAKQKQSDKDTIEYTWRTQSGLTDKPKDGSLICTIEQNNKYYEVNTNSVHTSRNDTLTNVSNNHGDPNTTQYKAETGPCKNNIIGRTQWCSIDAKIYCTSVNNGLSSDKKSAQYNLDQQNSY